MYVNWEICYNVIVSKKINVKGGLTTISDLKEIFYLSNKNAITFSTYIIDNISKFI